jgi:hypothetical protein
MAGRKLLYMLRGPLPAGQATSLLPIGTSPPLGDNISVVLLDDAIADKGQFPGGAFVLQEHEDPRLAGSGITPISYAGLLRMIIEADSTIVI